MARKPRIGILTGGGDVPGLNGVIKSVTYRATELGYDVFGIRRGWAGLTHQQPGNETRRHSYVIPLDRINTRTIDRTGGTWLHSSRTNPRKMKRANLPPHLDASKAESMTHRRGSLRHHARGDGQPRVDGLSTTSSPSAATTRSATAARCTTRA